MKVPRSEILSVVSIPFTYAPDEARVSPEAVMDYLLSETSETTKRELKIFLIETLDGRYTDDQLLEMVNKSCEFYMRTPAKARRFMTYLLERLSSR